MAEPDRIVLGQIGAAHGIKGEVRLKSFTDPIEAITDYGPLDDGKGRRLKITNWRASKGVLIVRLAGIGDRNAAEALNGVELSIDRERLPDADDDEFYHADLIGLKVVDEAGTAFGNVIAVHDFGAGDLLEIDAPDGTGFYLPFTRETVPDIDFDAGRLIIVPPPGLLDDEGKEAPEAAS